MKTRSETRDHRVAYLELVYRQVSQQEQGKLHPASTRFVLFELVPTLVSLRRSLP